MKTAEVIEARRPAAPTNPAPNRGKKPPVKRLLLPAFIFVALVTQIPFIVTIYYSFQQWNIMRPDLGVTFHGFQNFAYILKNPDFWTVLSNTMTLTLGSLLLCLFLGTTFALLMNRQFFGKGIVRTMFVSPFFVMPAVAGIVWKTMVLNPNFGFSAYVAHLFSGEPVDWLAQHPLLTIVMIVTWQWTPFFMLVLLAGLQSLPNDLLEASQLDGATKPQQLRYVILPHLLRYFEVVTLLGLIFILQIFGQIYVTTNGGPGHASTNLAFYTYRVGFQGWKIGEATTVGVITVLLTIIFMTGLFMFLRRRFKEELS